MGVQSEALEKVNNNLNAIRIQQQTAGKGGVAFPQEPYSGAKKRSPKKGIIRNVKTANMTEEEVKSATDASTGLSEAGKIMRRARRTKTLSETDYESEVEPPSVPPFVIGGGYPSEAGGSSSEGPGGRGFPMSGIRSKINIQKDLKAQGIPFKTRMPAKEIQQIALAAGINIYVEAD